MLNLVMIGAFDYSFLELENAYFIIEKYNKKVEK